MKSVDIVGYIATVLVVLSMVFKTTTFKGTVLMRIINTLSCVFFIAYGFVGDAYPTGIANACILVINTGYLIKEILDHNKNKKLKDQLPDEESDGAS